MDTRTETWTDGQTERTTSTDEELHGGTWKRADRHMNRWMDTYARVHARAHARAHARTHARLRTHARTHTRTHARTLAHTRSHAHALHVYARTRISSPRHGPQTRSVYAYTHTHWGWQMGSHIHTGSDGWGYWGWQMGLVVADKETLITLTPNLLTDNGLLLGLLGFHMSIHMSIHKSTHMCTHIYTAMDVRAIPRDSDDDIWPCKAREGGVRCADGLRCATRVTRQPSGYRLAAIG